MDRRRILDELIELRSRIDELCAALLEPGESLEPVFPDWAQEKVDKRICLVCDEQIDADEKVNRGCHHAHMRRVFRAIERGEYSEFEAIELGLLAPKAQPGRRAAPIPIDPRVQAEAFAKLDEAAAKAKKKPPKK